MPGIGDRLGDKLGPLPVWAWGGIAGAAIIGGQALYRRARPAAVPASDTTATAAGSTPATAPASTTGAGAGSGLASFLAAGTYTPADSGPYTAPTSTTPATFTDNDEWLRSALTLVSARNGSLSMLQIDDALQKYLDGAPVTEQQQSIIELALRAAGPPPYSVPPVNVIRNPPAAAGGTPPPVTHGATPDPFYAGTWTQADHDWYAKLEAQYPSAGYTGGNLNVGDTIPTDWQNPYFYMYEAAIAVAKRGYI